MNMKTPAHPGEVFGEDFMKPQAMTVTETANLLGVSRKHLSNIINAKVPISADMAARIGAITKTSPRMWLGMQSSYDLSLLDMQQYQHIISPSELSARQ